MFYSWEMVHGCLCEQYVRPVHSRAVNIFNKNVPRKWFNKVKARHTTLIHKSTRAWALCWITTLEPPPLPHCLVLPSKMIRINYPITPPPAALPAARCVLLLCQLFDL